MDSEKDSISEVLRLRQTLIALREMLTRIEGSGWQDEAVIREADARIEHELFGQTTIAPMRIIGFDRALIDRLGEQMRSFHEQAVQNVRETGRGIAYELELIDGSKKRTGRIARVEVSLERVQDPTD